MIQGFSGFLLGILVSPTIKKLVLGAGDTSQNPEIIEMRFFRFSHTQIENLLDQIEAASFPAAFKHIISINLQQKWFQKLQKNALIDFAEFSLRPRFWAPIEPL